MDTSNRCRRQYSFNRRFTAKQITLLSQSVLKFEDNAH